MNRSLPLPLSIIFFLAVSGCLDQSIPTTDDTSDAPVQQHSFSIALMRPVVVYETEDEENLRLVTTIKDDCIFADSGVLPRFYYRMFDRYGMVDDGLVDVDVNVTKSVISIPLRGTSPWLIMGDPYMCFDLHWTSLTNITSGHRLALENGFDYNLAWLNDTISLTLEPGSTRATATWSGSPHAWRLANTYYDFVSGQGAFFGSLNVYFPDDILMREDTFSLVGGHQLARYIGPQLIPGEYVIEANASVPVRERVEIEYTMQSFVIHDAICDHGFEWPDLCT